MEPNVRFEEQYHGLNAIEHVNCSKKLKELHVKYKAIDKREMDYIATMIMELPKHSFLRKAIITETSKLWVKLNHETLQAKINF